MKTVLGEHVDLEQRTDSRAGFNNFRDHFGACLRAAHRLQQILGQNGTRKGFVDKLEVRQYRRRKKIGQYIRHYIFNSLVVRKSNYWKIK